MSLLNIHLIAMEVNLVFGFWWTISVPKRTLKATINQEAFPEVLLAIVILSIIPILIPALAYSCFKDKDWHGMLNRRSLRTYYHVDMPWKLSTVYYRHNHQATDMYGRDILEVWAEELMLDIVRPGHENWERWITVQQILYKIKRLP